jgi:ribose 5-phosphate isomerase B
MSTPPNPDQVRTLVRSTLQRLMAEQGVPSERSRAAPPRTVIDAQAVSGISAGGVLDVPPGALVTPLARELALERKISLATSSSAPDVVGPPDGRVAIGADHGGYPLKELLKPYLIELGWQVVDCGASSTASVDYPDFAYAVARLVADRRVQWGVIVDGAGIGSCMVANKVPGVRAALCYDQATAANSREHNHANVLTLGAGLIGPNLARQIVKTWLETPFGPGRHAQRVAKIMEIERRFARI